MESTKETTCEELIQKMNECLEHGDDEKCKDFAEVIDKLCKVEEN